MSSIRYVIAREILDSRGIPTIEAEIFTNSGSYTADVPSGTSSGIHEAFELRDNKSRYSGKGVKLAVKNMEKISHKITGMDVTNQKGIDNALIAMDGTENKSKLGANAILAVSLAAARAGAAESKLKLYEYIGTLSGNKKFTLPVPYMNIINGGMHAGSELSIQEFIIVPKNFQTFSRALRAGTEIYSDLKKIILARYGNFAINVGYEGGFVPPLQNTEEALQLIQKAINSSGYSGKVFIAMDAAASSFYHEKYFLDRKIYSSDQLLEFYRKLVQDYGIISIEDPFDEDDWNGFSKITQEIPIQVVGDDLLSTNVKRIQEALNKKACNCLLLKANQIGTLTETIEAAKLAMKNNWRVIVSHRSGDTSDSFIADLAVGLGCGQIKAGAPCRGERTEKYNQLLRISEHIKIFG